VFPTEDPDPLAGRERVHDGSTLLVHPDKANGLLRPDAAAEIAILSGTKHALRIETVI
jgi:hypothetical protein